MNEPVQLRAVVEALAARRGIDFRDYRPELIERALKARMAERRITDADEYRDLVVGDRWECERLISALVVPVTSLFRDADVFEGLRRVVGAASVAGRLRAWVIGAASGEEAWSVAAVLADSREALGGFEVLATDIDEASLGAARRGAYPDATLHAIPPAHRRHFLDTAPGVAVAPHLRAHVTFARHDIVGTTLAPPEALVASFQLVLFRNVLIYFDRRLQEKALERVAATLERGGHLVLGHVESLPPSLTHRLEPAPGVDERLRIFRRR